MYLFEYKIKVLFKDCSSMNKYLSRIKIIKSNLTDCGLSIVEQCDIQ